MTRFSTRPVLIAGPTASGKSALALALTEALGGVVINADSQQIYREWRILTARPGRADAARAPHRLYGHVGIAEPYSVGDWLAEVAALLRGGPAAPPPHPSPTRGEGWPAASATPSSDSRERVTTGRHDDPAARVPSLLVGEGQGGGFAQAQRRPERPQGSLRPIIVGGTGLYFKALTEGLAPIPDIPPGMRAAGEARLARLGLAHFAAELARRDPGTAAGLDLANPRRVLRAWEVLEATGTGLAAWQAQTPAPLLPLAACTALVLHPPRDWLRRRSDVRLDAMLSAGALDEVRDVLALGLAEGTPALKAVGAAELARHLRGELTLGEAAARAKIETARYAKRQMTWMRNRMAAWTPLDPSTPDLCARALALVAG